MIEIRNNGSDVWHELNVDAMHGEMCKMILKCAAEGRCDIRTYPGTRFSVEHGTCRMKSLVRYQHEILRGHLPPAKLEPSGSKAAWGANLDYYLNHRNPSPRNLHLAYDEMMKDFRDGRRLYDIGDWKLVFRKEFGHAAPKSYPKGWVPRNADYKKVFRVLREAKFISALSEE